MKARVKATGEIVEVREEYDLREAFVQVFYSNEEDPCEVYEKEELDFDVKEKSFPKDNPDYWTRLEHQYAGMAMQALLSSDTMMEVLSRRDNGTMEEEVAREAFDYAYALVEKLKEKEERK